MERIFFAASVGGAEKREDGTIVDHAAMRKGAHDKARDVLSHKKDKLPPKNILPTQTDIVEVGSRSDSDTPVTHVSHVKDRTRAMPERLPKEQEAVAV